MIARLCRTGHRRTHPDASGALLGDRGAVRVVAEDARAVVANLPFARASRAERWMLRGAASLGGRAAPRHPAAVDLRGPRWRDAPATRVGKVANDLRRACLSDLHAGRGRWTWSDRQRARARAVHECSVHAREDVTAIRSGPGVFAFGPFARALRRIRWLGGRARSDARVVVRLGSAARNDHERDEGDGRRTHPSRLEDFA